MCGCRRGVRRAGGLGAFALGFLLGCVRCPCRFLLGSVRFATAGGVRKTIDNMVKCCGGVGGSCVVLAVLVLLLWGFRSAASVVLAGFCSVLGVFVYENVTINGIYKGDGKQGFGNAGSGQMDAEKSAEKL